ncbi:sensor histidine kinase [Actinoplanes sp. CA-142083]|uniref:sensor histidine kinase n=1 Tax=Actinoplanes sp. CA-142083 TaxID=3239903 RepID=UPI003D942E89
METIRPATRRNATGPLHRLLWQREAPRPTPRRRLWLYAAPLGLLALIGLGFAAGEYVEDNRVLPRVVIIIMGAWTVLPVAVCVRWPVLAWRITYPFMFVGVINADPKESWPWNTVQILAVLLVLGRVAVTQDSAVTVWATTFSLVPVFLYAKDANAWGAAVLLVAIAALGNIVYRRRHTRELVAEQEELTALERTRRSVLEERARIAREMHDVVAHHMSMIAVRAETAPYRVPGLPESAQEELATIATAARAALTDMRRLLGALRAEDGEAPTGPQPGLADLDDLVTTARAAGVDVTLTSEELAAVPGTVGLAAYRITQEALANAARHAPGGPVTIDARGFADRLELTVRNKRTGPSTPGGGHGLIGMRERAALLGGELTAEPDRLDFVVQARLPFGKADQ